MGKITRIIVLAGLLSTMMCSALYAQTFLADPQSPCYESITKLEYAYYSKDDTKFKDLLDSAFANIQQLPQEYPDGNPWIGKKFSDMVLFLNKWSTFLPTVDGSHDTGLKYIEKFVWFYYKNQYGVDFVQKSPGREIMQDFARQRGKFMDSEASTHQVANWLNDVRIESEDYILPDPTAPDGGFKSFNEFFVRSLKDQDKSRPQTMPNRDYVISAPTDAIINSIPQKITDANTLIPTKGRQALNIVDMLGGSKYANKFIGGTALSCVLMPNTYHHYHAPVGGHVVETRIIDDAFYGYNDFPSWAPINGNVGYYGTDFSQFENFKRGYFIIDTGKYGHVAIIPVGLNTISSIVFDEQFANVTRPVPVKRGDKLGNFAYGGSMVIIVFEPDRYKSDAIRVRLGNQIGIFDTKASDPQ
ncbi:MAG: phosphatidylserine decarboxylase [Desulfuromonadales bacterium C00003068]|nr:MAG: phosphatidylserine decarboxylase [Desulfuromonadales bacterium C00003068]